MKRACTGIGGHEIQTKTLSVGVLGLGHIGSAVVRAIQSGRLPGIRLAGVFGRSVPVGLQGAVANLRLARRVLGPTVFGPGGVCVARGGEGRHSKSLGAWPRRPHHSSGVLAEPHLLALMCDLARAHRRHVYLPAGALASLEMFAVLREKGIWRVSLTTSKPPGTIPGETKVCPAEIFSGSARAAAQRYPRHLNIAATLGLLGIGLDETAVRLLVDPTRHRTCHEIEVDAVRGRYRISFEVEPATNDPTKTVVTADSIVTLLHALGGSLSAGPAITGRLV